MEVVLSIVNLQENAFIYN